MSPDLSLISKQELLNEICQRIRKKEISHLELAALILEKENQK